MTCHLWLLLALARLLAFLGEAALEGVGHVFNLSQWGIG